MSIVKNKKNMARARKTTQTKAEALAEIVPVRGIEKTNKILEALKNSKREKEKVPYRSRNYGFSKDLTIMLPMDTPLEKIIDKFERRFKPCNFSIADN